MHDFPFSQIETVYNLREENRQLRRAHQDMHTQLQDVKVKKKSNNVKTQHLIVLCLPALLCSDFKSRSLLDPLYNPHCYFGLVQKVNLPITSCAL